MNKAFEKIIEKLEEESKEWLDVYEKEHRKGNYDEYADGMNDAFDEAIEIVKQEAEQYNGGWIPCSERLPEPGKIVIVYQIYSWENFEEGAMVTIGRLRPVEKDRMPYWEFLHYRPDFNYGTIMDNGIICPGNEYVIAWQPLPEPYQPKGE